MSVYDICTENKLHYLLKTVHTRFEKSGIGCPHEDSEVGSDSVGSSLDSLFYLYIGERCYSLWIHGSVILGRLQGN